MAKMEFPLPIRALTEEHVLSTLNGLESLPTLPAFARRLLATVESENAGARDVTETLRADHAISMQVLRVANSAYYGLITRVSSLERAIMVLGFDEIRRIALSALVMRAFPPVPGAPGFRVENFWVHALACAHAARFTAEALEASQGELDEAYTAGLLHDTGKLVAAQQFGIHFGYVVHFCTQLSRTPDAIEPQVLGIAHPMIGRWLATMWNLPSALVAAIGDHHVADPGKCGHLAKIVGVANAIAHRAALGDGLGPAQPSPAGMALELGLTGADLRELAQRMERARSAIRSHFG